MNTIKIEDNSLVLNFPMKTDGEVSRIMNSLLAVLEKEGFKHSLALESTFPKLEAYIGKRLVFSTNLY